MKIAENENARFVIFIAGSTFSTIYLLIYLIQLWRRVCDRVFAYERRLLCADGHLYECMYMCTNIEYSKCSDVHVPNAIYFCFSHVKSNVMIYLWNQNVSCLLLTERPPP